MTTLPYPYWDGPRNMEVAGEIMVEINKVHRVVANDNVGVDVCETADSAISQILGGFNLIRKGRSEQVKSRDFRGYNMVIITTTTEGESTFSAMVRVANCQSCRVFIEMIRQGSDATKGMVDGLYSVKIGERIF